MAISSPLSAVARVLDTLGTFFSKFFALRTYLYTLLRGAPCSTSPPLFLSFQKEKKFVSCCPKYATGFCLVFQDVEKNFYTFLGDFV